MAIVQAKPRNTMPKAVATISADRSLSTGSNKSTCSSLAILPRMLKPMPVVTSAITLRRNRLRLLYWRPLGGGVSGFIIGQQAFGQKHAKPRNCQRENRDSGGEGRVTNRFNARSC